MRKAYIALSCILFGMLGSYLANNGVPRKAWAGITCTIPVILQNGTTADASQVMQDFNALAACFTNVATVSSVTCGPGLDGGVIIGTGTCSLSASRRNSPTTQSFLSGSGTYTVPPGVLWLEVHIIGGGAGGTGGGGSGANGTAGGSTCFGGPCGSGLYEAGGGGIGNSTAFTGGIGGAVGGSANCVIGQTGNEGGALISSSVGGFGGAGPYGGGSAKSYNAIGASGKVNTGAGGQGGNAGSGGGGAAYCYALIGNPVASYVYTVGAAGLGGVGGSFNGGAGGSGCIYIIEHYN